MRIADPKIRAFTVVELLVAAAVGTLALAAVFSGAISMQRCLQAGQEFAADKSEQTRLSDYLALDLRRALTVTPGTGSDGVILTVTIPDYYDADGKPVTPKIDKYVASYGTAPVTVVYRKIGTTITRTENGGTPAIIAENVQDFDCPVQDHGEIVTTRISFLPSFQRNGAVSTKTRNATTVFNTIRLRNRAN